MSKTVKVFFTLSILLNLVMGGVMLGHVYRLIQESPWAEIRGDLSPQTRQIMRQAYKDKHKEIWAMRDEMRGKKSALKKSILGEIFDEKAFTNAAKEMKSQNEKSYDARVDTFKNVLSKLPKEEREKMAQRTVDILAGHRKWDKSKDMHKKGDDEEKNPFARHDDDDEDKDKKHSKSPKEKSDD